MKNLLLIPLFFCLVACEKGEQGEPGKDGNANVKSHIITINTSDWNYTTTTAEYYFDLPDITDEILEKGTVNVFWIIPGNIYIPLPYLMGDEYYSFIIYDGEIKFLVRSTDGSTLASIPTSDFKVAIISGQ